MTTKEERMAEAELFLDLELATILDGQQDLVAGTIGPLMAFTDKHAELYDRLTSRVGHIFNPTVPDISTQAEDELRLLGIDPQVFRDAFSIASSGVASVIGW